MWSVHSRANRSPTGGIAKIYYKKSCRKLKKDSLEISSKFCSAAPTLGGNASSQTPKFRFAPDFGKCTALENRIEEALLIGHVMAPLDRGMVDESWTHEISQADEGNIKTLCIVHCHLSNPVFLAFRSALSVVVMTCVVLLCVLHFGSSCLMRFFSQLLRGWECSGGFRPMLNRDPLARGNHALPLACRVVGNLISIELQVRLGMGWRKGLFGMST